MQKRPPIPLPKVKLESPGDSNEETNEDAAAATPNAGDPKDGDLEVPSSSIMSLENQIHTLTTLFDAYWDEFQEHRVALSQDMDAIRAELPPFVPAKTRSCPSWLSSSHFTHRHHLRSDSLRLISLPLFCH